jgi:VIT1/CCC1 family predicted Fe2+/Mn2+ transporter
MLSAFARPTSISSSQSNKKYLGGLLITILIVILVLMLIGAVPSWPHSRNWGYRPVGGLGLILLIILILYMLGYV